jgi:5'(3')-deoxyribonucleotidase
MIESYETAINDTTSVINLFADLHDAFNEISNKFPHLKVKNLLIIYRNNNIIKHYLI